MYVALILLVLLSNIIHLLHAEPQMIPYDITKNKDHTGDDPVLEVSCIRGIKTTKDKTAPVWYIPSKNVDWNIPNGWPAVKLAQPLPILDVRHTLTFDTEAFIHEVSSFSADDIVCVPTTTLVNEILKLQSCSSYNVSSIMDVWSADCKTLAATASSASVCSSFIVMIATLLLSTSPILR